MTRQQYDFLNNLLTVYGRVYERTFVRLLAEEFNLETYAARRIYVEWVQGLPCW